MNTHKHVLGVSLQIQWRNQKKVSILFKTSLKVHHTLWKGSPMCLKSPVW
jgi:hypothetical protein